MTKYTLETKLQAIELYKEGFTSIQIQYRLNIPSYTTIDGWIRLFKKYGKAELTPFLYQISVQNNQFCKNINYLFIY